MSESPKPASAEPASAEPASVELEEYCVRELRRHEPPVDSPIVSGGIAGALLSFSIFLTLQYLPRLYSAVSAGGSWSIDNGITKLFFWSVFLGDLYGAMTLWELSATVVRLRVTFDAALRGFYVGGTLGACFGVAFVVGRELAADSTGVLLNWWLYADEATASALGFAAFGAALFAASFALWSRPARPSEGSPDAVFDEAESRLVQPPRFDRLAACREGKPRLQFGVRSLMALTTLIALLIGVPSYVHRELMTIPGLEPLGLAMTVSLVSLSLFVLPYGLYVVLRGPIAFGRLLSAIQEWRDFRQRKSGSEFRHVDDVG